MLKSYISGSMWLVPLVALMVYAAFQRGVHAIGAWMVERGWTNDATSFQALPLGGARSLLETLITLNLSFLVFTFGSLLVAIQVAGGQYTPRIIATTLLRDNVIRTIVGVFVFTLAFCVRVLARMKDTVDQLDLFVAGLLGTASVMVFLYLIDYAARLLRPVSIVRRVGEAGLGVIRSVYPAPTAGEHANEPARPREAAARVVFHEGVSGVVLAVDPARQPHQTREVDREDHARHALVENHSGRRFARAYGLARMLAHGGREVHAPDHPDARLADPPHDADGTQQAGGVIDQVQEHHHGRGAEHAGDEEVELVDRVLHPGQHADAERQGEDEDADSRPDGVVAQQGRRDDARRVLAPGDLDRHEQRGEGEDEKRQVERDQRLEQRPCTHQRQRLERSRVAGPAALDHPGTERVNDTMKGGVDEQREQGHQPHGPADVALQHVAPVPRQES